MNDAVSYLWFLLFRTRGIGPKSLVLIAKEFELHERLPEYLPLCQAELSQFPVTAKITYGKIRREDSESIFGEYEKLLQGNIALIYPGHPDSPIPPLEISPILFAKGHRKLLSSDGVAIVGARNVSDRGIQIAKRISSGLPGERMNVISGYAKGVDDEVHLAALKAEGTTTKTRI